MIQEPNYQQNIINWCLNNPSEFSSLLDRVQDKAEILFTDPIAQQVWPILTKAFAVDYQWPTRNEIPYLLREACPNDPTIDLVIRWTESTYDLNTTDVTGATLKDWLGKQELLDLALSINKFTTENIAEGKETLREFRDKIDSIGFLFGNNSRGTTFRPLDPEFIDNADAEIGEAYGGAPIPTGIYRLDQKLRDGGVRPHNCLIQGPSGAGKTTLALHIAKFNLRQGRRVVYYTFDDSAGELTERLYSSMLQRPFSVEDEKLYGDWDRTKKELHELCRDEYIGVFHGEAMPPNLHTPQDLLRHLIILQRQFYMEDKAQAQRFAIPEKEWGKIDLVFIDTCNQLTEGKSYRSEWAEANSIHQSIGAIPKMFGCPLWGVVQSGQQAVGAVQTTQRSVAGAYGINRPAKLVIGWAQSYDQYHTDLTIPTHHDLVAANMHHLWNFSPEKDSDIKCKPWALCVNKNTRGRALRGSAANLVKLPMLVNYETSRVFEDFTKPEELIMVDRQTQREEQEAKGESPRRGGQSAGGKRGAR